MTRPLIRLAVVLVLISGSSLALAFSTGPPASRTGAFAVGGKVAEPNCTVCHSGFPLNTPGATLQILDAPQFYWPDSQYTIRVRMTSTFALPRRWGFQLTAVRALNGEGTGTFDVTGTNPALQILNGASPYASRRYVEHTQPATFDNNSGPIEWTFRWRSPLTDEGRIFFFAAGNAANSNDLNSGDHIYTTRDTSDIHPASDTPETPVIAFNELAPARPNPFRGETTLDYTLAKESVMDLAVFDLQGRRVRSLVSGTRPPGTATARWDGTGDDGRRASAGVYFIRMVTPGGGEPITRKVMLTP